MLEPATHHHKVVYYKIANVFWAVVSMLPCGC